MWTETMFPLSATSNSLLDCWSYAGVGRLKRFGEPFQLFYFTEFFPTPTICGLFLKINQQTSLHSYKMWYNEARKRKAKRLGNNCPAFDF